ncbi:MAG: hypothetical protein KJ833_09195 [Alphaproteobacteria bacterium]|uniref:hypothetical protein n=1 Tax=Hyphomonas sp. TaxID=87 RepID=UPI001DEB6C88|nr:hypothetical protein [Hyphomonas sp.]MBU3919986.1 hypothetical protein [Alphaproteobacteria bacterium]MBU4062230.1 hypothetical protein [Alphaproteobacteria bacterium]MBU4165665.1 hypothetical protein [Alphaproteobacteria bacterium]MBU4569122.1 hypothetical protein [Alphaproteobacteria bacterium]
MTTLSIARPTPSPASSPVLDRIFSAAHQPAAAANDASDARISLIVRRRERQRRRNAR